MDLGGWLMRELCTFGFYIDTDTQIHICSDAMFKIGSAKGMHGLTPLMYCTTILKCSLCWCNENNQNSSFVQYYDIKLKALNLLRYIHGWYKLVQLHLNPQGY